MRRVFDFLRLDDIPPMTRPNYAAELRQMLLWGVVAGACEGGFASIVAAKTFHASERVTTIVWALPFLMNLLNVLWGLLLRGRSRRGLFVALTCCALAGVASVGLTPMSATCGAWIFAAQVGLIALFNSGLITLRTTMWRHNYPATHRARIAGRLQTVQRLLMPVAAATLSKLFGWQAWTYQIAYPAIALIGLISLIPMRYYRVRGERGELRRFHEHHAAQPTGTSHPLHRLGHGLSEAVGILRTDRRFAKYMLAQFLLGAANFFTEPLLVVFMTKRFDFGHYEAAAITTLTPLIVMLAAIRFWGPLFDRVGLFRFRIYNSLMWVLSYLGVSVAMLLVGVWGLDVLPIAIGIIGLSRVFNGLGRSGGVIAWFIGHLHFAREHQTELYMGIHVGLTGLRALVMPFVGLACSDVLGYGSFGLALLLAGSAHVMFRVLERVERRGGADQTRVST